MLMIYLELAEELQKKNVNTIKSYIVWKACEIQFKCSQRSSSTILIRLWSRSSLYVTCISSKSERVPVDGIMNLMEYGIFERNNYP